MKITAPVALMMCGITHSGKTCLTDEITKTIPEYSFRVISSRSVHDFLNRRLFFIFKDNNTVTGSRYQIRQTATKIFRLTSLLSALIRHQPVILDSAHLQLTGRRFIRRLMQTFRYRLIVVYANAEKNSILYRVKLADQRNLSNGEEPAWEMLFRRQLNEINPPDQSECDLLVECRGKSADQIVDEIRQYLIMLGEGE